MMADVFRQCRVTLDLAFHLQVRRFHLQQIIRSAHAAGRCVFRRAEHRVRQHRHLRLLAETAHFFCRQLGDVGQLFCARQLVDERIGDEQRVLLQHQAVHGGEHLGIRGQADHVTHVFEVGIKAADRAAQQRIGVTQAHQQRTDQRV